ncbi:MAG: hypothetical protein RLZZ337_1268 [Bacteroidota bacterium]|jgi:hypothetical protein
MNFCLSLCFLLFSLFALGQSKIIQVHEAKWQIELPLLDSFSANQIDSMMSRTEQKLNATYDASYDLTSNVTTYFMIKGEGFNMFNCQVSTYDSSEHDSWDSSYINTVLLMEDLIKKQAPFIELLDSKSETLLIDNVEFKKFDIQTKYPNNITLNVIWLCANFGAYDLSINISYTDETWRDFCLDLIPKSQFID